LKRACTVIAAALLAAGFLLVPGASGQEPSASPQPVEVTAKGSGSIVGGDVAHAKDDAVEEALRNAIEQTLGTMIQAESLVENSQLIEDRILNKTEGYIQKYAVVQEGKNGPDLYEVTVKATVKTADLKSDLDAISTLMRRKNMPRVMVLVEERNVGETANLAGLVDANLNTAETALTDAFMAKGFRFVDEATVSRNLNSAKAAAIIEGNAFQASALAKKVGAELVLAGKAFAKATEVELYGTKIRSQQATVTIKAIRANTGDVVAVSTAQGKYSHIEDVAGGTLAIQKACETVSKDLIEKILAKWSTEISSGTTITLNVKNVRDFAQLSDFRGSLKTVVRGINSVVQRDFSDGFATLEVDMKGKSEDLAQRLSTAAFQGYKVKVTGMTEGSVTVTLQESLPNPPSTP
jgi:hypothetical protein